MTFLYMITVLGTVALVKVATECNLTPPTEAQRCVGELGKPLRFHLPTNATIKTTLRKNVTTVIQGNHISPYINPNYSNVFKFLQNGELLLHNPMKNHSGEYLLEIYGSDSGKLLQKINFHLDIQTPVSEPDVSQTCLSADEMTVSCSAEGDEAKFTLSLDNELIRTRSVRAENQAASSVTISLHGQLVGNLVCNVQNNVSRQQTGIHLISCKGCLYSPLTVGGAVIATVVFFLLCLAVFRVYKHFHEKPNHKAVCEDDAEDIVYSDVRVTRAARQLHG